jgi:hypothetical protein
MTDNHAFSLTTVFAFAVTEAVVFGTLGFDVIPALAL